MTTIATGHRRMAAPDSPLERELVRSREIGTDPQMLVVANHLARLGVNRLAVVADPDSPSHRAAVELDRIGVMIDRIECEDDSSALNLVSLGGGEVASILPLQQVDQDRTLPLNPTGENVLAAILARGARGVKKIHMPYGEDGINLIMGVIVAKQKI